MSDYRKTQLDEIEMELVYLTSDFTSEDWLNMRTADYWSERDNYTNSRERNMFILQSVREYLAR